MSYQVKDQLEILFTDHEQTMYTLSRETGEFTFKDFLQTITQRHQVAYIELLYRCKDRDMPFNAAHQHIGAHISHLAQKAGYERIESGYVPDIFGNRTANIIYRRS